MEECPEKRSEFVIECFQALFAPLAPGRAESRSVVAERTVGARELGQQKERSNSPTCTSGHGGRVGEIVILDHSYRSAMD